MLSLSGDVVGLRRWGRGMETLGWCSVVFCFVLFCLVLSCFVLSCFVSAAGESWELVSVVDGLVCFSWFTMSCLLAAMTILRSIRDLLVITRSIPYPRSHVVPNACADTPKPKLMTNYSLPTKLRFYAKTSAASLNRH